MKKDEEEYKLSSEELHAVDAMNDKITCAEELLEMMGTGKFYKKGIKRTVRGNRVHIVTSVPTRNAGLYVWTSVKLVLLWAFMLVAVGCCIKAGNGLGYVCLVLCDIITVWTLYKTYRVSTDWFHERKYSGENFYKEIKDFENEKALVDEETAILLRYIKDAEDVLDKFYKRVGMNGELRNPFMVGYISVMIDTGVLKSIKDLEEILEEGYIDIERFIRQRVSSKRALHYSEASSLYCDIGSSHVLGGCEKIAAFNDSIIKAIEECRKYELKED